MPHRLLELFVLGDVDKWVDAAVGEHHDDGEVIKDAEEVDPSIPEVEEQEVDLVPDPTEHETEGDDAQRLDNVPPSASHCWAAFAGSARAAGCDRWRSNAHAQYDDHARVEDDEQDDGNDELDGDGQYADGVLSEAVGPEAVQRTAAVATDARSGYHVGEVVGGSEHPNEGDRGEHLAPGQPHPVPEWVHDGQIALNADGQQVVGGRDQQPPEPHLGQPQLAVGQVSGADERTAVVLQQRGQDEEQRHSGV